MICLALATALGDRQKISLLHSPRAAGTHSPRGVGSGFSGASSHNAKGEIKLNGDAGLGGVGFVLSVAKFSAIKNILFLALS